MDSLSRLWLFVLGVTLAVLSVTGAQAGEFKRFPEYAYEAEEAKPEVDVEALRELLRQAQELQKAQDKIGADAAAVGAPAAAGEASGEKPTAVAAKPPPKSSQAGCMYLGHKLIWEKVPGACKP